jgi:hypothetical protein
MRKDSNTANCLMQKYNVSFGEDEMFGDLKDGGWMSYET